MKERPILFSGPMVRAILSGRKTQTRRVVNPQPINGSHSPLVIPHPAQGGSGVVFTGPHGYDSRPVKYQKPGLWHCPYGQPGDWLWVREEHAIVAAPGLTTGAKEVVVQVRFLDGERRWTSLTVAELQKLRERRAWSLGDQTRGRFMYRSLSRITLEIVNVRVERLQDISEADAVAEGIHQDYLWDQWNSLSDRMTYDGCGETFDAGRDAYRDLWGSINGAGSWEVNPWVWVVEFKKL